MNISPPKRISALLCFLQIWSLSADCFAQIQVQSRQPYPERLPVYEQGQLDSLQSPGEGFAALNRTTGCLTYFLNGSWWELCGRCSPAPRLPVLDSAVQTGNRLLVHYKAEPGTEYLLEGIAGQSAAALPIPPNTSALQVAVRATNGCGSRDTIWQLPVQPWLLNAPETITIEGKAVLTRKIGSTRWFCEDYLPKGAKTPNKERPEFVTLNAKPQNVCPDGWTLPRESDWRALLQYYQERQIDLFQPALPGNTGLGLRAQGVYAVNEKKTVGEQAAYYWTSEQDKGLQKMISVSSQGFVFPSEKPDLAAMPLRCIRHETE